MRLRESLAVVASCMAPAFASDVSAGPSNDAEFALSMEKLEHNFDMGTSVLEIETSWLRGDRGLSFKTESEYDHGMYAYSENQLYYSASLANDVVARAGLRHEDWRTGSNSSLVIGLQLVTVLDLEVDMALFCDSDGAVEGRFEFGRDFRLAPRFIMQPKLELRSDSRDAESVTVELRAIYEASSRMSVYAGAAWGRVDVPGQDESSATALVGLTYRHK